MEYLNALSAIEAIVPIVRASVHRAATKAVLDYAKDRVRDVAYSSDLEEATDYTISGKKLYEKLEALGNADVTVTSEDGSVTRRLAMDNDGNLYTLPIE